MRNLIGATVGLCVTLGLGACAPSIPDSGAGVGFDTGPSAPVNRTPYSSPLPPADAVSTEVLPGETVILPGAPPAGATTTAASSASVGTLGSPNAIGASSSNVDTGADIAADTAAALAAAQANSGVLPVEASPQNDAPPLLNNPGISDENDFQAVSSRQSIESDAERLARNREQFAVVAPTAVPDRPSDGAPNIVNYALSTNHAKGTRVHTRTGINLASKAQRNCAKYASPDQAQIDFLSRGGPQKDRLSLDPDGDGYACGWDPAPFRSAVN